MFACVEGSMEVGTIVPTAFACLDRALLVALQALYSCTSSYSRPSIFNVSSLLMEFGRDYVRVSRFDRLQTITPGDESFDLLEHIRALGETANHRNILVESQRKIIQP